MENKLVTITVSERTLNTIRDGMEFYARFMCGQLDHLPPVLTCYGNVDYYELEPILKEYKAKLFPELSYSQSYSVGWSETDKIRQEVS